MSAKYELDDVDKKILQFLQQNGRIPFLEIARELEVSGGMIHQRVEKLIEIGIIKGFQAVIDRGKLGYDVAVLVGVHLTNAKDCAKVIEKLKKLDEVAEAHYTTGNYALVLKVYTKSIQDFQNFLMNKLQLIGEIRSTESFVCLETPIERSIAP